MDPATTHRDDVLLWETEDGLRCTFARLASSPPFEITIQRGPDVLKRLTFEHDEDAADFAIAAMHAGDSLERP
jgi:hypothetical protein